MARLNMRDRLTIGQRWRRRRDRQIGRVRQIHRADRVAELELLEPAPATKTVLMVGFTDLRTKWRALDEPPAIASTLLTRPPA